MDEIEAILNKRSRMLKRPTYTFYNCKLCWRKSWAYLYIYNLTDMYPNMNLEDAIKWMRWNRS